MTDTTAPAADDLREAIVQATRRTILMTSGMMLEGSGWMMGPRAPELVADALLALIAPRIAAARAEGRREGIAEAAGKAEREHAFWEAELQTKREDHLKSYREGLRDGAEFTATAIRALADAPRQDAGGMTEGG